MPIAIQRLVSLLLAAVVFLAGCAGAQKRFEQGVELESEGRYMEAAQRYIQSLRKDRDQEDVRERLLDAGTEAIDQTLRLSDQDRQARQFVKAARAYHDVDDLVRDAAGVGVALLLPDDYQVRRADRLNEAIGQLMAEGEAAENAGRWGDAARAYDQVSDFEPSVAQIDAVEKAHIRTTVRWAEADLAAGRFKSAVQRAEEAIELLGGPDSPAARSAVNVRAEAIERGTLFVAMTEFWRDAEVEQVLPEVFLDDLNDVLHLDYWSSPPLFIATADPVQVRREVRREGYSRSMMTPREAARVGQAVDADLVVIGDIKRFTVEERDANERIREVKTRDGDQASFTEISGTLRYDVEVAYEIIETRSRRVVDRGRVRSSESGKFERGVYDGDYQDLNLSNSQRRMFDRERQLDQERAIEEDLINDLTQKLASSVYDDLMGQVP